MKAKGTSFWEQYIEYAVLLVAIAILGWFAWGAFATKVEVTQGKNVVQASNVDALLLETALQLEVGLNRGDSPIELIAPEAQHNTFASNRGESITPQNRLLFPTIDMTAELASNQDVQSELRRYVSPTIPGPSNVRTRQWFGTITESAISSTDGLDAEVQGPPHDTMWVQIASSVDIESILGSFGAKGELSAIPSQWYDNGIDIFDVVIERQEQVNGEWEQTETVSVLINQRTFRPKLEDDSIDAIERDAIIQGLRKGEQTEVVNPEFYPLKGYSSDQMTTPEAWFGSEDIELSPLQILQESLVDVDAKVAKQEGEIQGIEKDIRDLGGGGSGGRGGSDSDSNDRKIKSLQRKLTRATDVLTSLNEQKVALELEIENETGAVSEQGIVVLEGQVWVWGHDLEIQPGSTYRYRVQLKIANPFYGHKPSLFDRQKQLANEVVIASAQSEWSEPIEVQDSGQWFVKNAKPSDSLEVNDPLDYGYISIDVFEFTDGLWTKASRDVRVGQPLALDGTDWFVLDVVEDISGDVVLLQNISTGQLLSKRPSVEEQNQQWKFIKQQIRDQAKFTGDEEDETDSSDDPPDDGDDDGPIGGGSGGGAR